MIPHTTERIESSPDGRADQAAVPPERRGGRRSRHPCRRDEVDFRVVATNPTRVASQAHWAQPCIRVDRYAGVKPEHNSEAYLPRCFIEVDG